MSADQSFSRQIKPGFNQIAQSGNSVPLRHTRPVIDKAARGGFMRRVVLSRRVRMRPYGIDEWG